MKVSVHHWRYENGWCDIPAILQKNNEPVKEFRPDLIGWHCWVYPYSDDMMSKDFDQFEQWLKENCPSADYSRRYNSGDPMVTVFITSKEEAALFRLTWGI